MVVPWLVCQKRYQPKGRWGKPWSSHVSRAGVEASPNSWRNRWRQKV